MNSRTHSTPTPTPDRAESRPTNELVARNLRRYRQERGLSLGELARRAGLSKQTLSTLEHGTGNPTVDTLALLGGALDVPARHFFTEWGSPVYVQRSTDAAWTDTDHGERVLDEVYGSGHVRTTLLRPAVGRTVVQAHAPGTLHHLYVIEGRLRVGPVEDTVDLHAGDFVRFPGDVDHSLEPLDPAAPVLAHLVTTSPQVRAAAPTPVAQTDRDRTPVLP